MSKTDPDSRRQTGPPPGAGPNIDSGLERFWRELRGASPELPCSRARVSLEEAGYVVPCLGRSYRVDPGGGRILGPPGDPLPRDPEFQLLLLGYLVHPRGGTPPSRESPASRPAEPWVSERQLPGGSLFFQGPHALPLSPLLRRYGNDGEAFRGACAAMGGTPLPFGDAAFAFSALPLVPLAVVLWLADEEFPARAGMLFRPSVADHLPLDLVLALARVAVLRLEGAEPSSP